MTLVPIAPPSLGRPGASWRSELDRRLSECSPALLLCREADLRALECPPHVGVGFEALLAHKPVVCFGRSEYDCAVFSAEPDGLPAAWEAATGEAQEQRVARYARFVDWFMARHAVDLQRPVSSRYVLDRIVREAVADANARREGVP